MSGTSAEGNAGARGQLYLGPVLIPRSQLVALFALVALLLSLSTCERAQTSRVSGDMSTNSGPSQSHQLALAQARDSRAASLHRASQCAARRGDFRMGLFHLHAAASAGFDDFLLVLNDPLMRPLHSDARWTLVLDLIKNNYLSAESAATSPKQSLLCEHVQRNPNEIPQNESIVQ